MSYLYVKFEPVKTEKTEEEVEMKDTLPAVEVHVKGYGRIKGTERIIGLETRIIINWARGNSTIHNFDFQHQAIKFVKEKFGEFRDGRFTYVNLFNKYGDRGYKW